MKTKDYRKLSIKKLESKLKELDRDIIRTYGMVEKTKLKPQHRKKFKREIAKIKTIISEKEKELK